MHYWFHRCNQVEIFGATSWCPTWSKNLGQTENPGVPVLFGGHNLPHLVEIGLTDLPKSGGAMAPPAPPGVNFHESFLKFQENLFLVFRSLIVIPIGSMKISITNSPSSRTEWLAESEEEERKSRHISIVIPYQSLYSATATWND